MKSKFILVEARRKESRVAVEVIYQIPMKSIPARGASAGRRAGEGLAWR
jgi:hypothetical protein